MLARKAHNDHGEELPEEWMDQVSDLLTQTYPALCRQNKRCFKTYGHRYSDEILLIVSFTPDKDAGAIPGEGLPLSFFISIDISPGDGEDKYLKGLLDFAGILIDEILGKFSAGEEEEEYYSSRWQSHLEKRREYYYKITRENIDLTIEANRLLGA